MRIGRKVVRIWLCEIRHFRVYTETWNRDWPCPSVPEMDALTGLQ